MRNDISLVILCGGKGTRLGKITQKIPKPLIRINKKSQAILREPFFSLI